MKASPITPMIRCAIYTRKSTEEGLEMEYNSLDAQRDAGEAYIRSQMHAGWMLVQDRYDDGAYSGGNMERPALQRLLEDVKSGKVQMVVVYKIDRLSRSLMDFAKMAGVFEEYGASFTSVTEQFSTASAIGRLHLNIILSFAQFERENSRERVLDKVAASKKKGMWMGGFPPLGYNVVNRKLEVNGNEAETVRFIYRRYAETHSVLQVVKDLHQRGTTSKTFTTKKGTQREGQPFTITAVNKILRNRLYLGKIHHKGSYYDGEHQPLVEFELWDAVQKLFGLSEKKKRGRKVGDTSANLLSGLLVCRCCKAAMTHTFTRKQGRLYRYYTSSAVKRGLKADCAVGTISAPSLEETVIAQIRAIIRQPDVVSEVWEQMQGLGLVASEEDIRRRLLALDKVWDELFPAEQRQLVGLLVKRVEMTPQGARIHLYTKGLEELLRKLVENKEIGHGEYHCSDGAGQGETDSWTGAGVGTTRLGYAGK